MRTEVFTEQVPRWCRVRADSSPRDDQFPLDDDGFLGSDHVLAPPGAGATAGALVAPADVAYEGATVLLGEPGAGKTSVFRSLVQGLPAWDDPSLPDGADRCLWIDGPDLIPDTWEEVLGRHLAALPSVASGHGPPRSGMVTVVIDQADESEMRRHLPSYLKRSLRNKDTQSLRLLLACRTGDYPPDLTRVLHNVFGSCSLVDLAPLSRADAVALVDSAGLSGEQLISEVVALRAGALASVPLTLELIVRGYRESGRLRGGAVELFDDGVRLLADEYDTRRLPVRAPVTTWPQRLEVAGRIAARLVLSGRRTLWQGSVLEEHPRTIDLEVATISGGSEQATGSLPFEVNPAVVDEVLSTGLFTASGNRRLAFRHSSLAAFLAARHLISRSVSDAALRRLFLVGEPEQDTASMPVSLRETAAWLVALAPDRTRWLASADPESLTMHSGLVRSDSVRELVVSRLLERAADVELGEARWQQTRWALAHPGLTHQLVPALTLDPADIGDWEILARARVALHLAEQCPSPELAPLLLKVAADPQWQAENRAYAARAAFACDTALAAPELKEVLVTLGPSRDEDAGLSLRGTLLALLWPRFLDTKTMLAALTEMPSDHRYGAYEHFLAGMPGACPEEDVHRIVTWLVQGTEEGDGAGVPSDRRKRLTEDRLVFGMVDRALSIPDAELLLPDLARILTARILCHEKAEFPDALNQVTPDGVEPLPVRDLRRKLAEALLVCGIEAGQAMRYFAWLIVREWEPRRSWCLGAEEPCGDRFTLLDAGDFSWALGRAADCAESTQLADAYAHLAEVLFDQRSQEHFELAYRSKDNPAWPYLEWFYDPIEIHGELARAWRANYRAAFPPAWPESAQFIALQRERLQQAHQHDTDSFLLLLWNLQVDPSTGKGQQVLDGNVSEWPGCSVFTGEELAVLPDCALEFLRRENDHADGWLGLGKRDNRAWAGLLSMVLLNQVDRLDDLEPDRWSAWVGAIAEPWHIIDSATWTLLLRKAVDNDPLGLVRAIRTSCRAQLTQGVQPWVLDRVDANWSSVMTEAWEDFLASLSAALLPGFQAEHAADALVLSGERFEEGENGRAMLVRTWTTLLDRLLSVDNALARSVVALALGAVEDGEAADLELAVLAAGVLLKVDGFDGWLRLRELIDSSGPFSRALALSCAGHDDRWHVEEGADEGGLSELYRWLNVLFPQDEYVRPLGVYAITPEMEALDWREALPGTLSRRGTPEAVEHVRALAAGFPTRLNLRAALLSARANCLAATWTPVNLDEVVAILAGVDLPSDPTFAEAELAKALEAFQDMGSHAFREGIVRDMQQLMNSDRLLPIPDHNLARDHLRAIARYLYGEGGPEARRALLKALEEARPDERALEPLRGLLAVRDSRPARGAAQAQ